MLRLYIIIAGSLLFSVAAEAQSFKERYADVVSKDDPVAEEEFLREWEMADSNDAELYTAFFNYYVNKSRRESITIGETKPDKGEFLVLTETDSTKKTSGYMYNNVEYDPDLIRKGFYYADKGIEKFPSRLDMRFGKIYVYSLLGDYDNYTKEIIKTINYSDTNNNKWFWTDNEPLANGKKTMLDGLQGYILQLYETNDDGLLKNMMQIAEATLKYYPDNVESLSNLSIVYLLWGQFDEALGVLLVAENLNPTDFVVLGNIAQAYKLKGNKAEAIKYYKLMLEHGDNDAKAYARSQIELLEKQ